MSAASPRVLLVEDQIGDLLWLLDLLRSRGYEVAVSTNEKSSRQRLEAVKHGTESYTLAIVDVMVATKDLADLLEPDDSFFEDSRNTGIRLCRYAREDLRLSVSDLLMVCLTVRDDEEVKREMLKLNVPLFNKASPTESIRDFIECHLPVVGRATLCSEEVPGDS